MKFNLFLVSLFVVLASINFNYGFSEDHDGFLILGNALTFGEYGYRPTRALGYPFYDLILYPLVFYGGENLGKLYSMVLATLSVILFYQIVLLLTENTKRAFLGSLCFVLYPLTIISGNTLTETSQGILLGLLALYCFLKFCRLKNNLYLIGLVLFAALATATRQDYFCLSAALFLSLFVLKDISKKKVVLAGVVYLFLTMSLYPLVYGYSYYSHGEAGLGFLALDSFLRKLGQAFFGLLALIGLPALAVLLYFSIRGKFAIKKDPFLFFFVATSFFYMLRYATLPVKLEYVFILIPLLILFCAKYLQKEVWLMILAVGFFLPNIFQLHFFERTQGQIQIHFGFSPGSIAQDRSGRLRIKYITSPEYVAMLWQAADHFGCEEYVGSMTNWVSKETENAKACIIVPEERLRFWNKDRLPKGIDQDKLFKRKIIVYTMPDNRGWRQFLKFHPWEKVTLDSFRLYESFSAL